MGMLDDILASIRQKMYSNPYVQGQPQPPAATVGGIAGGQSGPPPQMGGMAGDAQIDLKLHPLYVKYALTQQEQGVQALPYDQWKAALIQQMSQGQAAPPQQ